MYLFYSENFVQKTKGSLIEYVYTNSALSVKILCTNLNLLPLPQIVHVMYKRQLKHWRIYVRGGGVKVKPHRDQQTSTEKSSMKTK